MKYMLLVLGLILAINVYAVPEVHPGKIHSGTVKFTKVDEAKGKCAEFCGKYHEEVQTCSITNEGSGAGYEGPSGTAGASAQLNINLQASVSCKAPPTR